jgi:hypothetical protein
MLTDHYTGSTTGSGLKIMQESICGFVPITIWTSMKFEAGNNWPGRKEECVNTFAENKRNLFETGKEIYLK